jgi:O-antigen ligase
MYENFLSADEKAPYRLDKFLRVVSHLWIGSLIFSVVVAEGLAILIFSGWLITLRRRPRNKTALDLPVLIFLIFRILTIATSIDPAISLHALRKIPFLFIYFPLSDIARREGFSEMRHLLRTLVISAAVVSLYALTRVSISNIYRVESTTAGPTTLAMFLAAAFAVGSVLIAQGVLRPLMLWLPNLAGMMVAIGFTKCRAPWITALILAMAAFRRHRALMLLLSGFALFILSAERDFTARYEEIFRWPYNLGDRPIIWESGIRLLQDRPLLGYGPGTFKLIFDRRHEVKDRRVGAWHNYVLEIWLESGFFAVMIFLWIIFRAYQRGLNFLNAANEEERTVIVALLAGLSALLIAGFFGGLVGDPIIDLLFWGIIGLVASLT